MSLTKEVKAIEAAEARLKLASEKLEARKRKMRDAVKSVGIFEALGSPGAPKRKKSGGKKVGSKKASKKTLSKKAFLERMAAGRAKAKRARAKGK